MRTGNHVVPWIDGEPAFRRICEAIELAQERVWATITFMWPSFQMPDGRGSALDVLERAARRGVDVRLLCWRPDGETAALRLNAFWGSAEHFELLSRYPRINVRWDRAHPGYCQHQKSWLIDPEGDQPTAFIGGINLNPNSLVTPQHLGDHQNHDVYVEVAGPVVADVHHNFAQRWNEASERTRGDGRWGERGDSDIDYPTHTPRARGDVVVQIQRTTHAGRYADNHPPPGASPYPIESGERTNLDQYRVAIASARRTIYLEHQYLEVIEIISALDEALARGVEIVAMLPAVPELPSQESADTERVATREARARLATYEHFTLCGMAGWAADGSRTPVYVHSKLMLVDDEWASVGSCNLHRFSLVGNGEMNAAFTDARTVRAMRVALFQEHLGADTAEVDDIEALRMFRRVARANKERHVRNDPRWQGMAFVLDAASYGLAPQF
jgi:phosphatidylserine/phosphatidylglycerophosphate/cardiolipin synthase-like enzyme